jgi:hypothetical protein
MSVPLNSNAVADRFRKNIRTAGDEDTPRMNAQKSQRPFAVQQY